MKNFKLIHLVIALLLGATLTTGYFLSPAGSGQGYFNKDKVSRFFNNPFEKEPLPTTRQNAANDPRMKRGAANPTPQVLCLEPQGKELQEILAEVRKIVKENNTNFEKSNSLTKPLCISLGGNDSCSNKSVPQFKRGALASNSTGIFVVEESNPHADLGINSDHILTNEYFSSSSYPAILEKNNSNKISKRVYVGDLTGALQYNDYVGKPRRFVGYLHSNKCSKSANENETNVIENCILTSSNINSMVDINYPDQTAQLCDGTSNAGGCLDVDYQEAEKLYNCAKAEIQGTLNKYGKLPSQF